MSLVRNGAYTLASSVAQILLGIVSVAILARALGPAGKGIYDLYWTTANMAVMVFGLSLPAGVTYTVARGRIKLARLVVQLVLVSIGVGAATVGATRLLATFAQSQSLLPNDTFVLKATGITAGGLAALNLFRAVIAGQREFGKVSLIDVVRACLVLAAVCVAVEISVHATSRRVHLIVLGNSVAILFSAVIYLKCLGRTRVRVDRRSFRTAPELVGAMAYAAPAYLANLIQYLNYRVDVFFVSGISGVAAVGNYQLAVMIAESLRVLPTATQAVIWPTIASRQKDERANANLAVRSARAVFFVTLMASAVVAIVGMLTIPVFFGQAYAPSVNALLALLPGLAMFAVTTVLAGYIAGTGRPELNLRASAAGLVATIVLDCVLIPRYGILGAAVASSISYTITTAWTLLLVARLANVPVRELLLPARDDFLLYRRMLTEFRRRPAA